MCLVLNSIREITERTQLDNEIQSFESATDNAQESNTVLGRDSAEDRVVVDIYYILLVLKVTQVSKEPR